MTGDYGADSRGLDGSASEEGAASDVYCVTAQELDSLVVCNCRLVVCIGSLAICAIVSAAILIVRIVVPSAMGAGLVMLGMISSLAGIASSIGVVLASRKVAALDGSIKGQRRR